KNAWKKYPFEFKVLNYNEFRRYKMAEFRKQKLQMSPKEIYDKISEEWREYEKTFEIEEEENTNDINTVQELSSNTGTKNILGKKHSKYSSPTLSNKSNSVKSNSVKSESIKSVKSEKIFPDISDNENLTGDS